MLDWWRGIMSMERCFYWQADDTDYYATGWMSTQCNVQIQQATFLVNKTVPPVWQACLTANNCQPKPCCSPSWSFTITTSIQTRRYLHYSKRRYPQVLLREWGDCRFSGELEFTGVGSASRNRTAAPAFFLLLSQNKQQGKVIFPFALTNTRPIRTKCLHVWLLLVSSRITTTWMQQGGFAIRFQRNRIST